MENIFLIKLSTIIFSLFFTCCSANNLIVFQDTLSSKTQNIVSKLDSVSQDEIVDLNTSSIKFKFFLSLINFTSQDELLLLVKNHSNPVVKGYAYIGLVIAENKKADIVLKKHYKKLTILVADEGGICNTSEAFIMSISKKKYRLQRIVQNKQKELIEESEQNTIKKENEIRKEQDVAPRKLPEK